MDLGKKVIFYGITLSALLLVAYFLFSLVRAAIAYDNAITLQKGWSDGLYRDDTDLGYALSRNASGYEILSDLRIPVETDAHGMRVNTNGASVGIENDRKILFLGDSFTFGASVSAEHSFPQIVAEIADASTYNAGVPGYGASHMILQAERLIPTIKPDIVVFQFSPWLVERSMSPFSIRTFGKVAQPYFSGDMDIRITNPLKPNRLSGISISDDFENPPGVLEKAIFLLRHGLPAMVMLDIDSASLLFKGVPVASTNALNVTRYAYARMTRVAKENSAIPIVLVLGSTQSMSIPPEIFPEDAHVVDAQYAMISLLRDKTAQAYAERYWHWKGNPPVLIDYHPNQLAHQIIAETLAEAIRPNLH